MTRTWNWTLVSRTIGEHSTHKTNKPFFFFNLFSFFFRVIASNSEHFDILTNAWTAINRLSIIWKSDLTDKRKRSFFQAAVASILLYGCTTWTLTKRLEKKLEGNYTRMLRAILNKSWRQYPTRHQLYGHLSPITKTIQVSRTRHAGQCWRSRDELIRDVLLWTPTHGRAKAGRPARTYIQQLCEDTGCCPEDLARAINDREEWRERGQEYPCYQHDMMMKLNIGNSCLGGGWCGRYFVWRHITKLSFSRLFKQDTEVRFLPISKQESDFQVCQELWSSWHLWKS